MNLNKKFIMENNQKPDSLIQLPPKKGRYIVLDTETTGLDPKENNIIELAAIEIYNGKLTGREFHSFMSPRYNINKSAEEKHKMSQNFYQIFYKDVYISDKQNFESFLKFIGNSIIFAHNAIFDMKFINKDLKYWGLNTLTRKRFRCSMRLFKLIVKPDSKKQKYKLEYCCSFFNLTAPIENFHSAIFDAFMTARMVCCLFQYKNNLKINEQINNVSNGLSGNKYNNNIKNNSDNNHDENNLISPYKTLSDISGELTKGSTEHDVSNINNHNEDVNKDLKKNKNIEIEKEVNKDKDIKNQEKIKNNNRIENNKFIGSNEENIDEDEPITINENELDMLL